MKVVVMGGAGKQGSHAAAALARQEEISGVVLADTDAARLATAVSHIGDKARHVVVDAGDREAVDKLLQSEQPTVVLSTVGPGYRFATPLATAAIRAGIHYVDIQDDAEAVAGVMELEGAAREAGVTVVSGVGLTPGLSNILVRRASDELDEVESADIYWVANMTEHPTVANWGHRLGIWGQDVPIVMDSALATVEGGTGAVTVKWPAPAGNVVERLCAHPDVLTLHRRFPAIRRITVRGGYTPEEHDELLSELRRLALTSFDPMDLGGSEVSAVDFMSHFATTDTFRTTDVFRAVLDREREIGDNNGLRVEIVGTRNGENVKLTYVFFSQDRNLGIYMTAAVVTYLVATRQIQEPGLFFGEDLDPKPIVKLLGEWGVAIDETSTPVA